MAQKKRYFRLQEHVGVHGPVLVESINPITGAPNEIPNPKEGELEPLTSQGLTVAVPTFDESQRIGTEVRSVEITPDGTYTVVPQANGLAKRIGLANTDDKVFDSDARILELSTLALIDGVEQLGHFDEIDPPKKTRNAASAGEES